MPLVVFYDIVLLLFLMCLLHTCFSVSSHTKTLCWFQSHSFNQKVRIHSRLPPFQKAGLLPTGCGSLNYSNLPGEVPWDNFVIMWSYTNKVELSWTELNWIPEPSSIFPRIDKRQADRGSNERQGALILARHPVSLPLHLSLSHVICSHVCFNDSHNVFIYWSNGALPPRTALFGESHNNTRRTNLHYWPPCWWNPHEDGEVCS